MTAQDLAHGTGEKFVGRSGIAPPRSRKPGGRCRRPEGRADFLPARRVNEIRGFMRVAIAERTALSQERPYDVRGERRNPSLEPDAGVGTLDLPPHRMKLDGGVAATYWSTQVHPATPFTVAPSLSYKRSFATPPCHTVRCGGGTNVPSIGCSTRASLYRLRRLLGRPGGLRLRL
jgi:hypothetical protein